MSDHSPEPWRLRPENKYWRPIEGADGEAVLCFSSADDAIVGMHPGDIRRIVACVNACKGIPTEALEHLVSHKGQLHLHMADYGITVKYQKPDRHNDWLEAL